MKTRGALLGTMSGSMGSVTATRGQAGQVLRQRVIGTNPASANQAAARGNFGAAIQLWQARLTAAQRAAWDVFAANTPKTDALGSAKVLTGRDAFVASASARARVGLAAVLDAPTLFSNGEQTNRITNFAEDRDNVMEEVLGFQWSMETRFAPTSDGGWSAWWLGPPQNQTRKNPRKKLKFIRRSGFFADQDELTLLEFLPSNFAGIGIPLPGQFRLIRIVNFFNDGRVSSPYEVVIEVVDAS